MKKRFFWRALGVLLLSPALHLQAEDVLMPQLGKQVVEVAADQVLTYYDYKGTESMPATTAGSAFATTIFKPAQTGYAVRIEFQEVEIKTDNASYNAYLKIYDGVFDTLSVTYPTEASSVTAIGFPHTTAQLDSLVGTYTHLSYTSTDPEGALSVCLQFKNPNTSKGWVATVSCIEVKQMEVKEAVADYTQVDTELYPNEQAVSLAALRITTEGLTPAATLQTVSFTLAGEGIFQPSALRLYAGSASRTDALSEIDATLTETDGQYTFTLTDYVLASGDNYFCIGGDVLPAAPFHAVSALTLTGIQTSQGILSLSASAASQTVAAMVLMANGKQQLSVSQPVLLYDDGGPEGKISNNFEGTYTFLPTTLGSKVAIDMRNISIFYTSSAVSVGNQDILAVYDGMEAVADSLLYVVQAEKLDSLILHSTAKSGALTVYLRSKTPSSYYQGEGFKATLSEFVPQAMVVESAAVSKPTTTPAACSTAVEALAFTLKAQHTEPALVPASFTFTTDATYPRIAKATLFYGNKQVGEASVADDTFTIRPTEGFPLREGDNTFRLLIDLACTAQTGEQVAVNISSVSFTNGSTYADFENPEGTLTIKNTAYSECGSKTIEVLGEWQFTHTVASAYSSNYYAEQCDQTTTFLPTTAGHIIEVDFADFAVYYSSSYYGTKAKFQVYAGSDTSGDLLWAADATNCTTGPGKVRSTATDGGLTIVFNPNTISSYYTKAGWHATVREYLPKPMQVGTPVLTLPEQQAALTRNLLHTPLLDISLPTTGMLNPLAFTQLTVTLAEETVAALDSLLLLRNGEVLAQAKVQAGQTQVVLSLSDCTLLEGENTFTLAANIAADAPFGSYVSLAALSLRVGDQTLQPVMPVNARPIVNIYCLQTDYRKVEVGDQPLTFYDAEGPEGNLTQYAKGAVTFVPTVPNTAIQLRFIRWDINGADAFYVYYADSVQTAADLTLYNSTQDLLAGEIVSESESGALTVRFAGSYNSTLNTGWEVEVSCHALTALQLDSVVVSNASAGVATKGSTDVPMLQIAVCLSGDRGSIQVEQFNLTGLSDDITPVLYYTGSGNTFANTTAFDAHAPLTRKGTYYYWAALNIDSDAQEGVHTLACESVQIDGIAVSPQQTALASLDIISGMHGTYRIGDSEQADFHTIQSAVDALAIGIDGAVTFQIESGTYNECVRIPELTGLSATNTLTIESLSGNKEDVQIHYESYSPAYGEEYGVFNILGADYVTLRHLTFYTSCTSFAGIVFVGNISRYITLQDCYLHAPLVDSGTDRLRLVYTKANNAENQNNDYFTLTDCLLEGGYIGLYLGGTSYVSYTPETGAVVCRNTFRNQGNQSLYVPSESNITIQGNSFYNDTTTKADFKAMDLKLYDGGDISANYIYLALTNYAEAIYLRNVENTAPTPTRLYNNAVCIEGSRSTSTSYGLSLTKVAKYLDVANNTFYTACSNAVPMIVKKAPVQLQVRNNICYNDSNGLAWQMSGAWGDSVRFCTNLLYTRGTTLARLSADDIPALSDWVTAVGDMTTISEQVTFRDSTLNLTAQGNLQAAEPISYLTTDIVGTSRALTPTIGAYEWIAGTVTLIGQTDDSEEDAARGMIRKVLRNGQLYIIRSDKQYDLLGRER
ncbi:MAG: hypothetical protein SPE88_04200 [Paludibacteraceae bacterium]|nr:hypothetical protein [Paludibacteraceae bacterium]